MMPTDTPSTRAYLLNGDRGRDVPRGGITNFVLGAMLRVRRPL